MEKFELTEELKTQVATVDFQHSILIDKINQLTESFKDENNYELILKNFNSLARFTTQHFQYEQMIFTNFNYKKQKGHIKRHTDLLNNVSELIATYEKTKVISFVEVYEFLKQWLQNHIQVEDKGYVSFMKENNVP